MQTRLIVAAVIQIMVFVEILSEGLVNSIPQLLKTALIHLVDCISNHAYAIRYNYASTMLAQENTSNWITHNSSLSLPSISQHATISRSLRNADPTRPDSKPGQKL